MKIFLLIFFINSELKSSSLGSEDNEEKIGEKIIQKEKIEKGGVRYKMIFYTKFK